MKKMLVALFCSIIFLSGCGNSKTKTTACSVSQDDVNITLFVEEADSKVDGMRAKYTIDFGEKVDEETQKLLVDTTKAQYKEYEGVSVEVSFEDTKMILSLIFDLETLDNLPTELGKVSERKIKEQKASELIESLSNSGFTCEEEK